MNVIFKYRLARHPDQFIRMQEGAAVLHVAAQLEQPTIWASVDPEKRLIKRRFVIYPTGAEISPLLPHHVGSFLLHGGALVFHVFTDRVEYPIDDSNDSSEGG